MISTRRRVISYSPWPGFVDALSSLLMVVIFIILIFVLAQFMLSQVLDTQENELTALKKQMDELVYLLGLEEQEKDELKAESARLTAVVGDRERALEKERELSAEALAEVAALDLQLRSLRRQLEEISRALSAAETDKKDKEEKLAELGRRLNIALARQVNRLQQYQSEFFRRLKETIGDNPNVKIEGDRFVLQAELLFDSGSAEIGPEGRVHLQKLAGILRELAKIIPDDINWILRVDGHTDRVPINTEKYPSNWELSTARAVSVLRFLADQGIPQNRMTAAGFSKFHPIDPADTPEARRKNRRIEIKLTSR